MNKAIMAECLEEAKHLWMQAEYPSSRLGHTPHIVPANSTAIATLAVALYQERMRSEPAKFISQSSFKEGILEGIKDYHEGRVESWNQVKKELELG